MTHIFDGKKFAEEKLIVLKKKVTNLPTVKIPKLVSIIVGDDPASIMYQNMKKKRAESIGCELLVVSCEKNTSRVEIIKTIKQFDNDSKITGIMVQLPLPEKFSKEDRDEIIDSISPEKDVDGLRVDSKFTPPTAKAVTEIFSEALKHTRFRTTESSEPMRIAVVGATGFIGAQIVRTLKKGHKNIGIEVLDLTEANSKTNNLQLITYNSDVVISVTGIPNLVTADMVKDGAILIDVGAPKGDIEKEAYKKAIFVSPVPGGVGPVTIACLMENLVHAAYL